MAINSKNGFSLIELLIVIALIAVVGAIAAPNFSRYRDNANLKEAARDIESDIQLYKQRTVAENMGYRIVFNPGANTYTVQNLPAAVWTNIATKTVGMGHSEIQIIGGTTYGSNTLTIQPRGTTTAGQLTIQHTRRQSTATIITSSMGRVRVTYVLK